MKSASFTVLARGLALNGTVDFPCDTRPFPPARHVWTSRSCAKDLQCYSDEGTPPY